MSDAVELEFLIFCTHGDREAEAFEVGHIRAALFGDSIMLWPTTTGRQVLVEDRVLSTVSEVVIEASRDSVFRVRYRFECECGRCVVAQTDNLLEVVRRLHGHGLTELPLDRLQGIVDVVS